MRLAHREPLTKKALVRAYRVDGARLGEETHGSSCDSSTLLVHSRLSREMYIILTHV